MNSGHKTRRISNKTEIGKRTCTRTPVRRAQGTTEIKQKPVTVHGRTAYKAQANFVIEKPPVLQQLKKSSKLYGNSYASSSSRRGA
jgi:hypothetical protein